MRTRIEARYRMITPHCICGVIDSTLRMTAMWWGSKSKRLHDVSYGSFVILSTNQSSCTSMLNRNLRLTSSKLITHLILSQHLSQSKRRISPRSPWTSDKLPHLTSTENGNWIKLSPGPQSGQIHALWLDTLSTPSLSERRTSPHSPWTSDKPSSLNFNWKR